MDLEDTPVVEHILDVVDDEMAPPKKPKLLLFDVGGVCVVSPFQAILDYELSQGIPPGWVNYSISRTSPTGFWHRLETGSIPMDATFFAGFRADLHDQARWEAFYAAQQAKNPKLPRGIPPVPQMDTDWLFHEMIAISKTPDPWMYPALKALRDSGEYMLGALSNTVIFPPDHEFTKKFPHDPVRPVFDFFISSAHVGLRKPDPRIYELALKTANEFAAENAASEKARALGWGAGIEADDVLFFDDIGENLKAAKKFGFGTVKVSLGKTFEAVDELERVTGLALAGKHPRIPVGPSTEPAKAKI